MKILHKYVLKEHVGPLLFALSAVTSILLLQYVAKRFGDLVGKGLPWSVIGEFLALSVPLTVALSMPMAVLVSTLYAFSRLASENEITAMKAGGVSLRNLLTPVLLAAAGVTLFMVAFNDQILPRANHKLRTLQGDIAQKKPTFGLREQVINEVSSGKLYLRAGHLSKSSNRMREVSIYDVGDATRRRTVYADSGDMVMSPNHSDLLLTLYNGTVQDVPANSPQELQRVYFDTELIRVKGVGNEFQKTTNDGFKGEREMSVCEMEKNGSVARRTLILARRDFIRKLADAKRRNVRLSKDVLATNVASPPSLGLGRAYCNFLRQIGVKSLGAQTISPRGPKSRTPPAPAASAAPVGVGQSSATPQGITPVGRDSAEQVISDAALPSHLEGLRMRVDDSRRTANGYEVEIQKKFALAAACFVFVLLGAPLALRFPRGGVGLTIGVSLAVFSLYYVGLIGGESLARRSYVPPFVAMWGVNAIFTVIALILLSRMGTESGSGRGGDIRDLLDTLKSRFRRSPPRRVGAVASPRPSAS